MALIGLMLFILVSPLLYYESPIGIHVVSRAEGNFGLDVNSSMRLQLNVSSPYVVVGYNYSLSPINVGLKNVSAASLSPISVEQSNKTVYLDYQLKTTGPSNYTLSFYNNATEPQTIYYEVVQLRFGNLPLYTALSYVEIVVFVAGIVVAATGAIRKPRTQAPSGRGGRVNP